MYIKNLLKKRLFMSMFTFAMIGIIVISSSHALFTETKSNEVDQALTVGNLNVSFTGGQYINNSAIEPMTDAVALTKEDNKYTFTITNSGSVASNYTISLIDNPEYLSGGSNYNSNGTILNHNFIRYSLNGSTPASLGEQDNNKIKIGTLNPGISQTFSIQIWVADAETYSLPNEALGSEIHLSIIVDNKAGKLATGAVTLMSKVGTTTNGGLKEVTHSATIQTPSQTDYRYYGANPDNWAYFNCSASDGTYDYGDENYNYASNCEPWRIIGVFDAETPVYTGSTITSYKTEKKIKLIRNESIGIYSWDTSVSTVNDGCGINEWSQADIMKLLNPGFETNQDLDSSNNTIAVNNSLYYNKGRGTCYDYNYSTLNDTTSCDFTTNGIKEETKRFISETKYYTSGYNDGNIYSPDMYSYERGELVGTPETGDTVTRKTNSPSYIGLMYVSDYGYAVDESVCTKTLVNYNSSECTSNNWIFNNMVPWTITPYINNPSYAWYVGYSGFVINVTLRNGNGVLPVLYLNSGVYMLGGNGTQSSPYKFSL